MDIDAWSLIVTIALGVGGGLAGAVAALYSVKSFRASRAQLEIARSQAEDSREQLELARNQASLVPRIELMKMSLHTLADDPELYGAVRRALQETDELRKKRAEEERAERERERRAREAQEKRERAARERKRGFNAETVEQMEDVSLFEVMKRMTQPPKPPLEHGWIDRLANLSTPPRSPVLNIGPKKRIYEGPVPNYYLDVGIRNVGRAAAYDVTGWAWFDKDVLEPIGHFARADVTVAGEEHGRVKVQLSVGNEGGRLFPSHNDPYTFRIPVLVHNVADTAIEFEFTSPQGEPAYGEFNLLLASGKPHE